MGLVRGAGGDALGRAPHAIGELHLTPPGEPVGGVDSRVPEQEENARGPGDRGPALGQAKGQILSSRKAEAMENLPDQTLDGSAHGARDYQRMQAVTGWLSAA